MKKGIIFGALISAAMICISGCSAGFVNSSAVKYSNADKYTAGDREITDKIDELDIEWPTGTVNVSTSDNRTVSIKETTKNEIEDKYKVHSWAEGSTLHIRFCKSGERCDEDKTLDISVPKDIEFKDINVDCSSADVTFEGLSSETVSMDASSGNMTYNGNADSFSANTSSGNIGFSGKASTITTDCSSGEVSIEQKGKSDSIDVDTSSGDINISAEHTDKLSIDSSSGDKVIRLAEMPSDTSIEASSGSVELYLPENADFTAEIDTSSGDVDYDLPMTKKGDDTYICGSGTNELSIDTSSGNVKIMKY